MTLFLRPFRGLTKACRITAFLFGCFPALVLAQANNPASPASSSVAVSPCSIIQNGPHHRLWQRVTTQIDRAGNVLYRTNSYTQLGTGLNYRNGEQWVPSSDQIQLTQNGAAATNTQHQVAFAANLNTAGAINLTTPDNQQMASHVLGLAYYDSSASNNVLFAETQDSTGQLPPSGNQVIYTNAFTNADCDVLYTHRLNGFEQDIVIRQQLPSPASFGLTGSNIWLQVWTEFTAAPIPQISQPQSGGDSFLDFGIMKMGHGRAFMLGSPTNAVPVIKEWVTSEGRTFLVESVLLNSLAAKMAALPTSSGSSGNSNSSSSLSPSTFMVGTAVPAVRPPHPNFKTLKLPPPQLAKHTSGTMRLAAANPDPKGLVLDYNTINGSQTNFTFQSDTTYYITNEVDLFGTNVIEGGTVIKYSTNGNAAIVPADLVWKTGPYQPAIFTAMDDDSVGQQIPGSSGDPTAAFYGFIALNLSGSDTSLVSNARFSFLNAAIAINPSSAAGEIRDVQFNQCQTVMAGTSQGIDGDCNFNFYNVLAWNIGTFIGDDGDYGGELAICQNCTIDGCSRFFVDPTSVAQFYNSIVASVGTWNAYSTSTNNSAVLSSDSGVFQSVGAGNFYLAPGTYQGMGTSAIDSTLLADLGQRTTYPPIILSNTPPVSTNTVFGPQATRDNSGSPDLGYHYASLDYLVDAYTITNATLTLTNGVAIACYTDPVGIYLFDGSAIASVGTPTCPNWFTTYQMVQEQAVTIGAGIVPLYINAYHYGSTGPNGLFQFTRFSGGGTALYDGDPYAYNNVLVEECEFWAGGCLFYGSTNPAATTVINNSLFARCNPDIEVAAFANFAFSNNLVWCAPNVIFRNASSGNCYAFNNVFDTCYLGLGRGGSTTSNGYNAYLNCADRLTPPNAFDIVTNTSLVYQSGPLGSFYQPAGSPLLNQGSTNANLLGLYEYTAQTNEVKEATNTVTIGYHYVATDTNGNPDSTLWLGVPDYLLDTNNDGDPGLVAWQMKYFGHTGLNPSADPFNQGKTLLQDYQASNDLTLIAFTLNITNNYISTTNSPVTLAVSQGIPYYLSVMVDNTNLSSATWTNYGSNIVVNVGTNQGWHDVWIGLSALPTNSVPVWQWNRLKLELTPPVLVITNPSVSTLSVPLVQLQGYSPEELNFVHYDLTNAAGVWTNLPGGISGQVYSTNTCEFTTNYFQCVDVFLTNGSNLITVHAADMAGNIATTNVSIVLDYSSRTNPPAVTLFWPQNGTLICNTNYTWRGWVDDPTATVVAQAVDTNGVTNIFNAIVERDGNFWVENMSIYCTNYLTLTVTDSAGNVNTTNITVSPSPVTIAITTPDSNSLWMPPITVTGTISDSSDYTLWVNGTQAAFTGGGNWTATNVYLPVGGTALFQARAIPNSDNGGNGAVAGGGGTNTSYSAVGNPTPSAQPNDAELQIDKPPRLYVQTYQQPTQDLNYNYSLTYTTTNDGSLVEQDTWEEVGSQTSSWTDGQGGTGSASDAFTFADILSGFYTNGIDPDWQSQQTWTNTWWPNLVDGTQTTNGYGFDPDVDTNIGPPAIIMEHCNINWPIDEEWYNTLVGLGGTGSGAPVFVNSTGYRQGSYTRSADVQMMLQTGGKSGSNRQNLFQFSASANENYPVPASVDSSTPAFVNMPILSQTIQIMGKNLGADGYLYTTLSDNIPQDVTPKAAGVNYFTFLENFTKYRMRIVANTTPLSEDNVKPGANFCVGQYVSFTPAWVPALPGGATTANQWTLGGTFVNDSWQYLAGPGSVNYYKNTSLLTNQTTAAWWVHGTDPATQYTAGLSETVFFTNGQSVKMDRSGLFTVYRPTVAPVSLFTDGTPQVFITNGLLTLGYNSSDDMSWIARINSTFDGTAGYTQLTYGTAQNDLFVSIPYFELDNTIWMRGLTPNFRTFGVVFYDNPNVSLPLTRTTAMMNLSFKTYLRFRPDAGDSSQNIYVTLRQYVWGVTASATESGGIWSLDSGSAPSGPTDNDSEAFPVWFYIFSNYGF